MLICRLCPSGPKASPARPISEGATLPLMGSTPPKTPSGALDEPLVMLVAELAKGREAEAKRHAAELELRKAELGRTGERRAEKALREERKAKEREDLPQAVSIVSRPPWGVPKTPGIARARSGEMTCFRRETEAETAGPKRREEVQ